MGMPVFIFVSLLVLTPIFLGIVWALCILCQLVADVLSGIFSKSGP